ncbi:3-dehydroquinate synthase [Patescibacteria group bacterium]|nr:3-dehydroquinate synthase [Patescibacteria group bacterium]
MKKNMRIVARKNIDESYNVSYCENYTEELISDLKRNYWGNKYAIITDSQVKKLYADELVKKLKKAGIKVDVISFPKGEKNKTFQSAEKLILQLSKLNFQRKDCIIGIGGGVVGDIAGFVASIYMRGIPFIQIPTTLLAMIDSSVGGKTGVDTEIGKNLIGTFHRPKKVYINPEFLKSLTKKQLENGFSELIKYGIIAKPKILNLLEKYKEQILSFEPKIIQDLIMTAVDIKASIVMQDEFEDGLRKTLNYGHTIGHAIEKVSDFTVQHGEAVGLGIRIINSIALNKKWFKEKDANRITALLDSYGLPNKLPKNINIEKIIDAMKSDKKAEGEIIIYVVPKKIGKVILTNKISKPDIRKACKKHM